MNDLALQITLMWSAVTIYIVALGLSLAGIIFQREKWIKHSLLLLYAGVIFQASSLGIRWAASGHAPYYQAFEIFNSDILISLVIFLLLVKRSSSFQIGIPFILFVSIPILGWTTLSNPEMTTLPPTFRSVWLVIHIFFAKLAFGSVVVSAVIAATYLMKEANFREMKIYDRLPELEVLDQMSFRYLAFGFVFMGLMIIAGAIWADEAWGRWWSWDPIETWSLFTWMLYGLYLHLRVTYKITGHRAQYLVIAVLALSLVFSLGTVYIFPSIHDAYLKR